MKKAFDPIVSKNSVVLILGTMPSEESLRKQQYYGHKNNQFWKITFSLFGEEFSEDYEKRRGLLLKNRIALWDVLLCCEGEGSADSDIRNEQANNFGLFFELYPNIQTVFFASKKAEEFYSKYVGKTDRVKYFTLPSPSSANARMTLAQKIEKWKIVKDMLMKTI